MPLWLLLILVVGGIGGITLLLHLSGKSQRVVMSVEDARTAWHRHFPDDLIEDALLSHDGHAALVSTSQGPGLVWAFGADTVARHLRDFDMIDAKGRLNFMFHDYTAPRVSVVLTDPERRKWKAWMQTP